MRTAAGFAGIGGALLYFGSCISPGRPDEVPLRQIILREVLGSSALQVLQGTTIVLDSSCIDVGVPDFTIELERAMDAAGLKPIVVDHRCDVMALPGEWVKPGNSLPQNQTHVLLHVSVEGEGHQREVEWGYSCGPLCGHGETFLASWNGEEWTLSQLGTFVN